MKAGFVNARKLQGRGCYDIQSLTSNGHDELESLRRED